MLVKQISWADDGAKLENMHAEIEGNKHRCLMKYKTESHKQYRYISSVLTFTAK